MGYSSSGVFYSERTEYIFHNTLCSTLLFLLFNTIGYVVCKLLQIRGHRFDSGTRLHLDGHVTQAPDKSCGT